MLEMSGAIEPLKVDGRAVSTMPRNPAQAAAEQQEVGMASKFIQLGGAAFPEEFKVQVDGGATLKAIAEKMRVTKLIKFRAADQIKAAVAQIAQLVGGREKPGAPDQPAGPAS